MRKTKNKTKFVKKGACEPCDQSSVDGFKVPDIWLESNLILKRYSKHGDSFSQPFGGAVQQNRFFCDQMVLPEPRLKSEIFDT